MASNTCNIAIENVLSHGKALLKFVSPNDVGTTGSHQCGFYLPKSAWKLFTPNPPIKGQNSKSPAIIKWQDERVTESCVTWYGAKTRSEYRLTRFGSDFPWLKEDNVGNLFVLVPTDNSNFLAFVLDLEEDIEEIQATLGIELYDNWAVYPEVVVSAKPSDCIDNCFHAFVDSLKSFPSTMVFSQKTLDAITTCEKNFQKFILDDQLMTLIESEYKLFKLAEQKLCKPDISKRFESVDEFVEVASTIMNRRKARAGRSLENHVAYLLKQAEIPFDLRPSIDGKIQPDILIPGKKQYIDPAYPVKKLYVIGIKRTCKDRWRQVLSEAKRIPTKHILTIQPAISVAQLKEMHEKHVNLIVPKRLQMDYPATAITMLDLKTFVDSVHKVLA
ncbi:MAG: type II restriction endonuclease [Phycisphaerae bacterium]|jgi:type II restriction enzyme